MNKENTHKLWKKYPNLYSGRWLSIQRSLIPFGFECGDGWYNLIDELSAKLEKLGVVAVQVKEKFGGLSFYIVGGSSEVYDLIDEAEQKSHETCEVCGEKGKTNRKGWLKTLCESCKEKRN